MKSKYPIVLVHGVMIKDIKFFKAFGRIEKVLNHSGYKTYSARIDGLGSIENNARQLRIFIEDILAEEGATKVNIIAHSKGGLDAKYMITRLAMEDKVASLTTLCTPHKGSPIASTLLKLPMWIKIFISFWLNFWYKIFGDKKPDALKVCEQLQRINSIESECIKFNDKVYCQSYCSKMEKIKDDFVMGIPLVFSKYVEINDTDGLVPEDSTIFGVYKGTAVDNTISHSEIVDFMVSKKKKEKIYRFYLDLCDDLSKRGF